MIIHTKTLSREEVEELYPPPAQWHRCKCGEELETENPETTICPACKRTGCMIKIEEE